MSNRFTKALESIATINDTEELRFYWQDLKEISDPISDLTAKHFFGSIHGRTFQTELNERWVFLCFLAAMSDSDIDELIINYTE